MINSKFRWGFSRGKRTDGRDGGCICVEVMRRVEAGEGGLSFGVENSVAAVRYYTVREPQDARGEFANLFKDKFTSSLIARLGRPDSEKLGKSHNSMPSRHYTYGDL